MNAIGINHGNIKYAGIKNTKYKMYSIFSPANQFQYKWSFLIVVLKSIGDDLNFIKNNWYNK